MSAESLLRMTAPLRPDFAIPYHDIGERDRPPRLALVGGLHGNELNGVFVLSRLASFLRKVALGQQPGQSLVERVLVVPAVNVLGVNTGNRRWPFDGTDINRMFPGYDRGETTQRIAGAVLELTRAAHYRVDVHASNLEFEELPQVRLYAPSAAERASAVLFGLPAVVELPPNAIVSSTLVHAWRASAGESFVLQAGLAGALQPHHCERVFRALVGFLHRTGIVRGARLAEEEDVHCFGVGQSFPVIAETAGLFVSPLQVGRWVRAGEVVGQVFDGFDGELRAEIRAPLTGLLSGLRRQPLLYEGDLVARLQSSSRTADAADTFLPAQGQ
jgi:predicted deacylase